MTKTPGTRGSLNILAREQVRSQEELAELLERYASVHVTQATLSRDLDELGVVRLRLWGGSLVYSLPEEARRAPARTPAAPGLLLGGALGGSRPAFPALVPGSLPACGLRRAPQGPTGASA